MGTMSDATGSRAAVKRRPIPPSKWNWCGYAGHFICAHDCLFRLSTKVGDYRVSTVGDLHPRGQNERTPIGAFGYFETMVFRLVPDTGEPCCGEVADWAELECVRYDTDAEAREGHMRLCRKWAAA